MAKATYIAGITMAFLVSCSTPSMVTTWKNRDSHTASIHSILVVGIIGGDDSVARSLLENYFAIELKKIGYNANTASVTFGAKGLASLGQEQTLAKLCNYGFDAVMTIALLDESKVKYNEPPVGSALVASYYLDRIWNYEKIGTKRSNEQNATPHFWECIVYDLYALRPLGAIQTRLYDFSRTGIVDPLLAQKVVSKMTKQKIVRKRNGANRPVADQPIVKQ